MNRRLFALLSILIASTAFGQLEVTYTSAQLLNAAKVAQIDDLVFVESGSAITTKPVVVVTVKTEAANIEVDATDTQRSPVEYRQLSGNRYMLDRPGKYWVEVTAIDFAKNIYGKKTVVVEVGKSPAPGPTPPGPGPTPPPTPDGNAPIEGLGLRVLFVHESSQALPSELQEVFYGATVRSWLNVNAIKVDGVPDWRIVDPDTKYTDPNHRFAKALARPRTSLPWLIVSNGSSGYEGPFPGDATTTLEFIKAFATSPQPQPQPNVEARGSVVMYSGPNCLWCDKWKSMELQPLLDSSRADYREIEDTSKPVLPTFLLQRNGRQVVLSGYQTTAKILEELSKL